RVASAAGGAPGCFGSFVEDRRGALAAAFARLTRWRAGRAAVVVFLRARVCRSDIRLAISDLRIPRTDRPARNGACRSWFSSRCPKRGVSQADVGDRGNEFREQLLG